jgi:large-conductance mechanosensitive channel
MNCDYNSHLFHIRDCTITHQVIHKEDTEIEISNGKQFTDVRGFSMSHSEIIYFPLGIDKYFPDLMFLVIIYAKLRKITAENLSGFPKITYLDLSFNNLVILEANLFKHNPKLEEIRLQKNFITFIDPTVFVNLKNLKKVDLRGNTCYLEVGIILANAPVITKKIQNSYTCPQLEAMIKELSDAVSTNAENYQNLKVKLILVTLLFIIVTIALHVAIRLILYKDQNQSKITKSESKSAIYPSRIFQSRIRINENLPPSQQLGLSRGTLYSENASYEEISQKNQGNSEDLYEEFAGVMEAREDKMSTMERSNYAVI